MFILGCLPSSFMINLLLILMHLPLSQDMPVCWFWKTSLLFLVDCLYYFFLQFYFYYFGCFALLQLLYLDFLWSLDFLWDKMLVLWWCQACWDVRIVEMYGCAFWSTPLPTLFRLLYYSHCIILLYFEFYINKEACLCLKKNSWIYI